MASAAWRNTEGVPLLEKVAASFAPMRPDFPIPQTTSLLGAAKIISTAAVNDESKRAAAISIAAASARMASRPVSKVS